MTTLKLNPGEYETTIKLYGHQYTTVITYDPADPDAAELKATGCMGRWPLTRDVSIGDPRLERELLAISKDSVAIRLKYKH